MNAFIVGIMRESAAGSAAASRIGRINRFMGSHIHNLAIVAILSETNGAPATFDALHPREVERQPISHATDSASWFCGWGTTRDSRAGGSKHLRRLDRGRATRWVPLLVTAILAAFPLGCHARIGCRHAAGDVGLASSFHGRRVRNRYVCWTDGDFAPEIGVLPSA